MTSGIIYITSDLIKLIIARQVTPEDLDKQAKELGVMSIETSAKAGHNVKSLFKKIATALPGGNAEAKDAAENQSVSIFIRVRFRPDQLHARDQCIHQRGRSATSIWLFLLSGSSDGIRIYAWRHPLFTD